MKSNKSTVISSAVPKGQARNLFQFIKAFFQIPRLPKKQETRNDSAFVISSVVPKGQARNLIQFVESVFQIPHLPEMRKTRNYSGFVISRVIPKGQPRNLILTFFLLIITTFVSAQHQFPPSQPDKILTKKLQELVKDFNGEYGIYVRHLKTGKTVEINADTLFPTASMIKVPIMIGIFDKVEKGELKYDSLLMYRDSLLYAGEDIVGTLKDSGRITLSKVVMLMITTSDNTGSLWCQLMAGTGTRINGIMAENGFQHTRVNSRTPGREEMRSIYGWGVTTPREMAELVAKIRRGKMISPWASERMYRNLARIYWDGEALSEIPPYIHAASKQGAVNRSRSEVVLVNAPSGDYVFCVITKNQQDESWERENEGYVLLRNVSRTLWQYFEPIDRWKAMEQSQMMYH